MPLRPEALSAVEGRGAQIVPTTYAKTSTEAGAGTDSFAAAYLSNQIIQNAGRV